MLNQFESRMLQVTENNILLHEAVRAMNSAALVEHFGYSKVIGSAANPLVVGVTQQAVITIQSDSWFVLSYLSTGVCLPDGSTFGALSQISNSGNILLQITDMGAGQELYNQAHPAALLSGTPTGGAGGIPYLFPTPRLLPPNTNVKIEVTQLGLTALTNPQPFGFYLGMNGSRVGMTS